MKTKRIIWRVFFAGILIMLTCCMFRVSGQTAQAEESDKQKLVIEVMEDIPAEEIEEQAVPLAALPDSAARTNVRHGVLAGVFLACILGYILYFHSFKKRLTALRETASEYGYEMLNNRRKPL